MPKRKGKNERGRPLERKYPPRIDATAEEIAQTMFSVPAGHDWEYLKSEPVYRCKHISAYREAVALVLAQDAVNVTWDTERRTE